jgi:hypothetical protein
MMAGDLQPLDQGFAIVNPDGTPTQYFILWAQDRQIDIQNGITIEQAQQLIDDWAAGRQVIAGSGLDGGGFLSADVTLTTDVQEILDQLSTTHGDIIYRDSAAWAVLAAGTAGQVLQTNGAGADPSWVTSSGGGGAAWSLIDTSGSPITSGNTWSQAVNGSVAQVDVDVSAWSEVYIKARGVGASSSGVRQILASIDGGVTFANTAGNYVTVSGLGVEVNQNAFLYHDTATTAARTLIGIIRGLNFPYPTADCNATVQHRLFAASASLVDFIRFNNSGGGNLNSGTFDVYAR